MIDKVRELHLPRIENDVIDVSDEGCYWDDPIAPKPQELDPVPLSKFFFVINNEPWVSDRVFASPVWTLTGHPPVSHWCILTDKNIAEVQKIVDEFDPLLPPHCGVFDPRADSIIGSRRLIGKHKEAIGYIVDDNKLVGIIAPLGRRQ